MDTDLASRDTKSSRCLSQAVAFPRNSTAFSKPLPTSSCLSFCLILSLEANWEKDCYLEHSARRPAQTSTCTETLTGIQHVESSCREARPFSWDTAVFLFFSNQLALQHPHSKTQTRRKLCSLFHFSPALCGSSCSG